MPSIARNSLNFFKNVFISCLNHYHWILTDGLLWSSCLAGKLLCNIPPPPFLTNMGSHPTCLLASSVLIGAWRRARPLHATSRTSYLYRWLAKTSADQLSRKTYYHSFFYIVIPLLNSCYLCSSTRGLRSEKNTDWFKVLSYLSLKEEHCTIQAKHFKFSRDLLPLHQKVSPFFLSWMPVHFIYKTKTVYWPVASQRD